MPDDGVDDVERAKRAISSGNVAEAVEIYRGVVAALPDTVDADDRIQVFLGLADALRISGRLREAGELTDQAVALSQAESVDVQVRALALNDFAVQRHFEQDLASARRAYEQARAIFESARIESPNYVRLLANLAGLLSRHFQAFSAAEELFERAVALTGRLTDDADLLMDVRSLYAEHFNEIGEHDRALSLRQSVLDERVRRFGPDAETVAETLSLLAHTYEQLGRYGDAVAALVDARAIFLRNGKTEDIRYAFACRRLGSVHVRIGNAAAATELLRESRDVFARVVGPEHLWTLRTSMMLAVDLGRAGEMTEALASASAVVEVLARGGESRDYAQVLHERGSLFLDAGRFTDALDDLTRAREIRLRILGVDAFDYAITQNNIARVLGQTHRQDEAEATLREAIDVLRRAGHEGHTTYGMLLSNMAGLLADAGRHDAALDTLDEVERIDHRALSAIAALGTRDARLGMAAKLRAETALYLGIALDRGEPTGPLVTRAVGHVIRNRSIEFEVELQHAALLRRLADDPHLRSRIARLREIQRRRTLLVGQDPQLAERRSELSSDADELLVGIWRLAGRDVPAAESLDIGAVTAVLDGGTAVLEFMAYFPPSTAELRLCCCVLTRDEPPRALDLGPVAAVTSAVDQFVTELRANRWVPKLAAIQRVLLKKVRAIVAPALDSAAGCRTLFVCPDGGLERIPFHVLLSDVEGGANPTVSELASSRDLTRLAQPAAPVARGVVVAAPDYDSEPARVGSAVAEPEEFRGAQRLFRDLAGAAAEARQIGELTDAQILLGAAARKADVAALRSPVFLHFATHGFALSRREDSEGVAAAETVENPLYRCGLALAGANAFWSSGAAWSIDGVLTGADAAELDLTGTQLVVLSACDSATGDAEFGEGVFGLHRAFLVAGAACVVGALWPVSDTSTQILMLRLYEHLAAGETVGAALAAAQENLRRLGAPIADQTAFVCFGRSDRGVELVRGVKQQT